MLPRPLALNRLPPDRRDNARAGAARSPWVFCSHRRSRSIVAEDHRRGAARVRISGPMRARGRLRHQKVRGGLV
jgi:hypothetical protein